MSIVVNGNQALITSDGFRRYFYVPANVKSGTIEYNLIGGGGGGGGSDYPYGGGNGSAAGVVTGTLNVNAGDLVEIVVGGGGTRGESAKGSARGGTGGLSYVENNGGAGGRSGNSGSSGAGGGGGGATVLKVNGVPKAIGAGGGGGGGGGHWNNGTGDSATVIEGVFNQSSEGNYSPTSNASYCGFLNTYGVNIGDGYTNVTYQWDVYFPATTSYTFQVSGDNEADILVDGVQVATTGNWDGGPDPYQNVYTGVTNVNIGWHSVTINGRNYGGPGSVGGRISYTTEIWNSRNARKVHIPSNGQQGTNHPGDGGGGGGGGGGYLGGGGGFSGESRGGDLGGGAGFIGRSYAEGGTITPQITNKNPTHSGVYGVGGDAASPGYAGTDGSGGSAFIFTNLITRNLRHKVNGTWKSTDNAYVKVGGTWKLCPEVWIKTDGIWRRSLLKTVAGVTWNSDIIGVGPSVPPVVDPPPPVEPTTPTTPTVTYTARGVLKTIVCNEPRVNGGATVYYHDGAGGEYSQEETRTATCPITVTTTNCLAKGSFIREYTVIQDGGDFGWRTLVYYVYADGNCGEYEEVHSETVTGNNYSNTVACVAGGTFLRESTVIQDQGDFGSRTTVYHHFADGLCGEYAVIQSETTDNGNTTTDFVNIVGNTVTNTTIVDTPITSTINTESTRTGSVEVSELVVTNIADSNITTIFNDGSTITFDPDTGEVVGSTEATDTVVDTTVSNITTINDDGSTITYDPNTGNVVSSTPATDTVTDTNDSNIGQSNDGDQFDGGCPDPTTLILISPKSSAQAGSLVVGDYIYTMHEITKEFGNFKIIEMDIWQQPKLRISFVDNTEIVVSESHRFLLADDTWNNAINLNIGTLLKGINENKEVASITSVGSGPVVKFEIEDAHTYVSAGLISHNIKSSDADSNYSYDYSYDFGDEGSS